jgi:hypothetical protein
VDVAVDAARCHDAPLGGNHLRGRSHDHAGTHARHDVGIPRLAHARDAAVFDADVRLHDAPVIEDQRIGDDEIEHALGRRGPGRLAHAVADHLAAAELHLVAIGREVALDLDHEIGVGEPDSIADGGAVEIRVLPPRDPQAHAPAPR